MMTPDTKSESDSAETIEEILNDTSRKQKRIDLQHEHLEFPSNKITHPR